MDPEQLRALQTPLKERYRTEPAAALITLEAHRRLGEGVSCRVETGRALVEAGSHPATAGDGLAASFSGKKACGTSVDRPRGLTLLTRPAAMR